ncbi:GntR family transcriptional regulator [Antarcticimicrobium sediminis]|uniref:GntR family transcriptional regulator n=1 Tax=Antarcticimicrobium sediminis TaxID=2546227 RepID=A0A4R5EQ99_9RHOB|nr:GntR family transcriptional regulator [Antarcticimicrobium sediminis]TDE36713.1 GntR family transcriptional regulator [Antarcticimicrobium sediminis]
MTAPDFERIRPIETANRGQSLRRQIYQDLREKLRHGEIGVDEKLVDVDIAKAAGVSRMPVREALLQLTIEGHLVGTTRGFALPNLTDEDVANIFEVRKLLEPRAVANATYDLDDAGLQRLRAAVELTREAVAKGDSEALSEANIMFRETWIAALRNRRLAATILRFADQAHVVRRDTLGKPDTQQVVLDGMTSLLDAFERRDAMAAHDRMVAFVHEAETSYFGGHYAAKQDKQPGDPSDE